MQLLAQRRAAQIPFQPSACLLSEHRVPIHLVLSQQNAFPKQCMTTHVHTSIGAAQEIPELHAGSQLTEDWTTAKSQTPVYVPVLSLHFLVVLNAVSYRRGKTPAHWLFWTDTPGGWVSFQNSCRLLSFLTTFPFTSHLPSTALCLIFIFVWLKTDRCKDRSYIVNVAFHIPASSD